MTVEVTTANREMGKLHPLLQRALLDLFQELGRRKLAVFMTEGWRAPERQAWLYASGRTRDGSILTYARPGESYHNLLVNDRPFSAAADFAIWDEDRPWSKSLEWSGTQREWGIFDDAARKAGLVTLNFELPHVQLPHDLEELRRGRHWPSHIAKPGLPDPRVAVVDYSIRPSGQEPR